MTIPCSFRKRLISGLTGSVDGVNLDGDPRERLARNVNVTVHGVSGEALVFDLRLEGICVQGGQHRAFPCASLHTAFA